MDVKVRTKVGMMVTCAEYREAQKEVQNIALDNNFAIPGDPGFPLNQVHSLPPSFLLILYFFFLPSIQYCPIPFVKIIANRCSTPPPTARKPNFSANTSRKSGKNLPLVC